MKSVSCYRRRWLSIVSSLLLGMILVVAVNSAEAIAVVAGDRDCVASNNEDEIAQQFIGRCCRGFVNSEFPEEWRYRAIGEIRQAKDRRVARAQKAWKLLNKCEYKK
jgi:hypothetical protein